MCFGAVFASLNSTQTFQRVLAVTAVSIGGQEHGGKEYPFNGGTNCGQLWRKGARKWGLGCHAKFDHINFQVWSIMLMDTSRPIEQAPLKLCKQSARKFQLFLTVLTKIWVNALLRLANCCKTKIWVSTLLRLTNCCKTVGLKPVLNWVNVCSPNILWTVWRTMICFLIELLVCWTWFGQSKLYFILKWLVMRCKLWPELAADAQQRAWSKM